MRSLFLRVFYLLLLSFLVSTFHSVDASAGSFIQDLTKSVRVGVPDKWKAEKPCGLNRLLLTCPDTDANILMLSQNVGKATLAECGGAWLKSISKISGYKLVSKENYKLAGVPGKSFTFTASVISAGKSTNVNYVQMLTVRNSTLYALQFVCRESEYKTCLPAFDSVISSLKWLK